MQNMSKVSGLSFLKLTSGDIVNLLEVASVHKDLNKKLVITLKNRQAFDISGEDYNNFIQAVNIVNAEQE